MRKILKSSASIIILLAITAFILKLFGGPADTPNSLSTEPSKQQIHEPVKETYDEKLSESQIAKENEDEKAKESFNVSSVTKTIKNQSSTLVLVNKDYFFDSDFVPEDLVKANIPFLSTTPKEQKLMKPEAAEALKKMFNDASKVNIKLMGSSGYRSYKSQQDIYNEKLNSMGQSYVDNYVALPGQSEHQTGLAMDVGRETPKNSKYVEFGSTKEGIWLRNNAHKYGFILRYPKGKEHITKYSYEPWHIRYVGKEAAEEMYSKQLVLEEYLENIN